MDQTNNISNGESNSDNYEAQGFNNDNGNAAPSPSISTVSLTEVGSNTQCQYNPRNPAVRRIMREAQEMNRNSDNGITAAPLEDNLFEWHFTIRGTEGTEFEQGLYHGRIILPAEYPMKPPSIIMLTPNGRFETGVKICLSISSYHPETWRPSWSIRTALLALQSFMNTPSPGAIGSLELPEAERRRLARQSVTWTCPICGPNCNSPVFRAPPTLPQRSNPPSAALRVFRGPAPRRGLGDEPGPHLGEEDEMLYDDRAGDVRRFGLLDALEELHPNPDGYPVEPGIIDGEQVIQIIYPNANANQNNVVPHEPPAEIHPVENAAFGILNVGLINRAVAMVISVIVGIIVRRIWHLMF